MTKMAEIFGTVSHFSDTTLKGSDWILNNILLSHLTNSEYPSMQAVKQPLTMEHFN